MGSVDRTLPEQRLDQRTFRQRAVSASRNHLLEHPLHAPEIGDLCSHVIEMRGSDRMRLGARLVAFVDEAQQLADFIKGEAEFPRTPNEAKAPLMRRVVAAIAARRARRPIAGHKARLDSLAFPPARSSSRPARGRRCPPSLASRPYRISSARPRSGFIKHLISVSIKPAAAHSGASQCRVTSALKRRSAFRLRQR